MIEKYECTVPFRPVNGSQKFVPKGSRWEHDPGYVSKSDARLYLEDGDDDNGFIDVTYSQLNRNFTRIN